LEAESDVLIQQSIINYATWRDNADIYAPPFRLEKGILDATDSQINQNFVDFN